MQDPADSPEKEVVPTMEDTLTQWVDDDLNKLIFSRVCSIKVLIDKFSTARRTLDNVNSNKIWGLSLVLTGKTEG